MKKMLTLILALTLCCAGACAQTLNPAQDDTYVCVHQTPDGQNVYYVASAAALEVEPLYDDVNFDGVPDLALCAARGASNVGYALFVNVDGEYAYVQNPSDGGLFYNFRLYPEQKRIVSSLSSGYAGALFERALFAWDDAYTLSCVRTAVSDFAQDSTFVDEKTTVVTDFTRLHIVVMNQDGSIPFERTLTLDEMDDAMYAQIESIFLK